MMMIMTMMIFSLLLIRVISANWSDVILLLSIRSVTWPLLNLITQIKMDSDRCQVFNDHVSWHMDICHTFGCVIIDKYAVADRLWSQWAYLDQCRNILDSIFQFVSSNRTDDDSVVRWLNNNQILFYNSWQLTMCSADFVDWNLTYANSIHRSPLECDAWHFLCVAHH